MQSMTSEHYTFAAYFADCHMHIDFIFMQKHQFYNFDFIALYTFVLCFWSRIQYLYNKTRTIEQSFFYDEIWNFNV